MKLKNKLHITTLGIIALPAIIATSSFLTTTNNIQTNKVNKLNDDKNNITNSFFSDVKAKDPQQYNLLQSDNIKQTPNGLAGLEHTNTLDEGKAIAEAQAKMKTPQNFSITIDSPSRLAYSIYGEMPHVVHLGNVAWTTKPQGKLANIDLNNFDPNNLIKKHNNWFYNLF